MASWYNCAISSSPMVISKYGTSLVTVSGWMVSVFAFGDSSTCMVVSSAVITSSNIVASGSSISATTFTILSDDDRTLSMSRPTSMCIGPGGEVWSAVVPIGNVLPNCAMINQEVIVIYNVRGMEKMWRRRDYEQVGISTYLLLYFETRVFTYHAPCDD